VNFTEDYAERGDQRLYAEAKGRTTSPGLDIDTLYGQLLRWMSAPEPGARYAVVVPTAALNAALRVPEWVRDVNAGRIQYSAVVDTRPFVRRYL
jgi:hypothetical protein